MRRIFFLSILIIVSNIVLAQSGKISGKVINAGSGQALGNATISLIERSVTTATDQNGNFSFAKLPVGTYSVKCTYSGHVDKIIDEIFVKENDNTVINISLVEKGSDAVVVTATRAKAAGESVASLLIAQKNNASVSDGITAESIKKTPDRTTSDVLKRVSGASIQDDRFAIIRGLNDRYNAAFINGAPLPSTESDRKAFAFDIFPSSILDNLVIYKTATPDRSGEFAGGIIDISTKSIPSKSFTSITFGIGFNSLITWNHRYFSENKGSRDWLGLDDGTRGLPTSIPETKTLKSLPFAERAEQAKYFGNYKWGVKIDNTQPNFNFQLSKGFNIQRKQQEFLGALFSVNYNRNYSFTEGQRNSYDFDLTAPPTAELTQRGKYKDSLYNDEVIVAALGNISVKLNNRHSLSWKNNYSINTDNRLLKRIGYPDFSGDSVNVIKDIVRWYTSNQIFSSQLSGEHSVGPVKTRINWLGAFSKVKREMPNLSRTSYFGPVDFLTANFSSGTPNQGVGSGTMFFTDSDEDIKSFKLDITQPYTFLKNSQNFVKAGAGYQVRERKFTSRLLSFAPYDNGVAFDYSLLQLQEDQIFLPKNLGLMENGKGGFLLNDGTLSNSNYDASSTLTHAYLMNDQRFFKKFRLIYGVRMERFNQKLNTIQDIDTINLNTTVTDFLPSVNFVYALTSKMNIRLSYAQTLNRPEFRELAPYLFYDNVTQYTFEGNITLDRAKITNYDFRYEFYPGKAQLFSVSAFYKEFTNPIEIFQIPDLTNQVIYASATSAEVYGLEVEFRTLVSTLFGIKREGALLSKFTLSANAAYTKSSVKFLDSLFGYPPSKLVADRALQGQSPYLINGSVAFNDDKYGISMTASVNRVGDRIAIAGAYNKANIYEQARTVIDFQMAKLLFKNRLELKFTARDILANNINFYYDYDQSKSFTDADRYFSTNNAPKAYNLSVGFKF